MHVSERIIVPLFGILGLRAWICAVLFIRGYADAFFADFLYSRRSSHSFRATWDGMGVNFAVFSANATKVELCLFRCERRAGGGTPRTSRIYTDEIWHGYLADARPGIYGYRVHGPYDPAKGHRFNPNKLLLDPYAKAHVGRLEWSHEAMGLR
jgi:isoamylase